VGFGDAGLLARSARSIPRVAFPPPDPVPAIERDEWVDRYFEILAMLLNRHHLPLPQDRVKVGTSKAKNLLNALLLHAEQVLARLIDLRIPFTNN
jgi:hypothetical protein